MNAASDDRKNNLLTDEVPSAQGSAELMEANALLA
jgi:hypothetical protein